MISRGLFQAQPGFWKDWKCKAL